MQRAICCRYTALIDSKSTRMWMTTDVREVKLNGEAIEFSIDFVSEEGFGLSFPLITEDQALLELTFDLPYFALERRLAAGLLTGRLRACRGPSRRQRR